MKNNSTALIALLLLLLVGCSSTPTASSYEEPSSSSIIPTPTSSDIAPTSSSSSSSSTIAPSFTAPSSSSTPTSQPITSPAVALYVGEIGFVCNGFNTSAVTNMRATEGYMAMYNICGDRATMTTGTQPRIASVLNDWMINDLKLSESLRVAIVNDVEMYGATFRFYNAVDGYLRYIYIEPNGDGLGLMKRKAT